MASSSTGRKLVAPFLSSIFPGLGQFYNRQPLKGSAYLVAGAVLFWLMARAVPPILANLDLLALSAATASPATLRSVPTVGADLAVSTCLLLIVWTWSMVDAWRAARSRT